MSRMVSFSVLVAILLVIAALFFRVMANFLLPMFLAVLLVVMFGPLHRWFLAKCKGYDRLAAGLTTVAIMLIFLIPVLLVFFQAVRECWAIYRETTIAQIVPQAAVEVPVEQEVDKAPDKQEEVADAVAGTVADTITQVVIGVADRFALKLDENTVKRTIERNLVPKLQEWLAPLFLGTTQFLGKFVLGLGVMVVSLYYFLADGPWMIRAVMRLSPLDDRYEEQLIDQFDNISRAVVLATLLSAMIQGLLAGVGYYLVGLDAVFLLTALTMLFAMIPFVGAAAIWVPVCLWLFLYEERHTAAIMLAVYGAVIVSMADNVIKPFILQGRSNLHPLLALLSVIGGVQALGPIGIFVGPMVVVFLHALLNMLRMELDVIGGKGPAPAERQGAGG